MDLLVCQMLRIFMTRLHIPKEEQFVNFKRIFGQKFPLKNFSVTKIQIKNEKTQAIFIFWGHCTHL